MNIKNIIKLTLKAKKLTEEGFGYVSKIPIKKVVVGTVITVVPGGMVATGAYVVGTNLLKKYKEYKLTEDNPTGFITWTKKHTNEELSNQTRNAKNLTFKTGQGIANHTGTFRRFAVKKASEFLKKK